MNRNIPQITIAKVMVFNAAGMPDCEQIEIAAIIETAGEISPLGRICFEDAEDLVSLYNILGTYIRMNDLDHPDDNADREEKGGAE